MADTCDVVENVWKIKLIAPRQFCVFQKIVCCHFSPFSFYWFFRLFSSKWFSFCIFLFIFLLDFNENLFFFVLHHETIIVFLSTWKLLISVPCKCLHVMRISMKNLDLIIIVISINYFTHSSIKKDKIAQACVKYNFNCSSSPLARVHTP